jgi:hypothetical protein
MEMFLRVRGPELLKQHAGNVLLVVLLIAAAAMFLYTRSRNKAQEQFVSNQNTAIAYDFALQLRDQISDLTASTEQIQTRARDAINAADLVLNSDALPNQKAAALLAKGEIYWALANAPQETPASTQPTTMLAIKPPSQAEYLDLASSAYTDILGKHENEKEYVGNALLSLAAIAETRRDFATAATFYQRAIDDQSLRSVYRQIAENRKALLDDIRKPVLLAAPTTRPTGMPTPNSFGPSISLDPTFDSMMSPGPSTALPDLLNPPTTRPAP